MRIIRVPALVVGSGCAGYNAADWLFDYGVRDVALLTEGREMGTSRNTGSDKQTYYKLSLCADARDSVYEMAQDLFAGGSVNGDTALCEAAGSVRAFFKLNQLGVPFPTNRYGEFVGYKTDHDPRMRATSVGPLTSRVMTEKLEQAVLNKGIRLFDRMQAVRLVVEKGQVCGLLALDKTRLQEEDRGLTLFITPHVVLCTGGPAIVYERSVYPPSQTGATGLALEAGAEGCNLNQWQYGLASVGFRWNLSGSYQQVLPRYVSVDAQGVEREFLPSYLGGEARALQAVFLKGYQWPFDSAKMQGSSLVDLAVYCETVALGRRVYLDYTRDPAGLADGWDVLEPEAREYLARSGALVSTPIERLLRMNPQAVELYRAHGTDLARDWLEIAVCAQHHNGGLAVDENWQTNLQGLYAAGEVAGTFGTARPGGSALNSTQVGAQRAAEHIAYLAPQRTADEAVALRAAREMEEELRALVNPAAPDPLELRRRMQREMTRCAAQIRDEKGMAALAQAVAAAGSISAPTAQQLPAAFKTRDMLTVQAAVLSAMRLSAARSGSLGSALVLGGDALPGDGTCEALHVYTYRADGDPLRGHTLRTRWEQGGFISRYEPVRPLPKTDDWFETTWQTYNQTHGIKG